MFCQGVDTFTFIISCVLGKGWKFPMASPTGPWDTISLLSAQCVTVTWFSGMPVPVAERSPYLVLFKAKSVHVHKLQHSRHQRTECHGKLLFCSQGDSFHTFPKGYLAQKKRSFIQLKMHIGFLSWKDFKTCIASSKCCSSSIGGQLFLSREGHRSS